jgi:hypothetical protein
LLLLASGKLRRLEGVDVTAAGEALRGGGNTTRAVLTLPWGG